MTVYVDDMYKYPLGQYGRMKMSHLIADNDEELHEMASKIGVARRWFQGDHYDISMSKRNLALAFGAVPVTLKTLARMDHIRKRDGKLPSPEEAHADRMKAFKPEDRTQYNPPAHNDLSETCQP